MRNQILAFVALAAATAVYACAEGPNDLIDPGSWNQNQETGGAKKFYIENVHQMFEATCTWCHAEESTDGVPEAPRWSSHDPEKAYANMEAHGGLIAHPKNSLLLLQGEHQGPALQPNQRLTVEKWLMMEVEERGLPTPENPDPSTTSTGQPPQGITAEEALDQFAACELQSDFEESMFYLLAYQQTTGWGPCRGCHNAGWAGTFIDDDATLMYEQNKKRPYVLKLAKATVENGAFKDIEPSNRLKNKGSEPCNYPDPNLCHPKFTLDPIVSGAVDDYFARTYERWSNGLCDGMGAGGAGGGGGGGGAGGGI